ncbi:hypothetical protein L1987_24275 [Smallanthus sonchifolius]|uniref:Uncharacterized protein n=1 Tax=Smallanthus sonchifolius TaxID=185202 RepID=A0ACB9IKK7_9ASTR|nr:hypothetical protein L1987_24275 [Smallanthus sonchifolius]
MGSTTENGSQRTSRPHFVLCAGVWDGDPCVSDANRRGKGCVWDAKEGPGRPQTENAMLLGRLGVRLGRYLYLKIASGTPREVLVGLKQKFRTARDGEGGV